MTSAHYIKVGKDKVISKSHTGTETIDVIGKGAFSRVFRGIFDDKDVAVKRVCKYDYKSIELRFLRDFEHENIVRYLYKDFDDDFMYIVMEKCDCTLQQFIGDVSFQKKGYISPIEILRQTTNGLAYLHDIKSTIHRDLKPSNTLLLLRGKKWVVRIADFGISKHLPQNRNEITQTSIGGTVGYAAPEVLNNEKISKKSDVFSLGILYYFTLSGGEHPYGTDMLKLQVGIRDGEQPTMGLLDKKYADDAKSLILSMIAHKCEDRFVITQVQSHHLFWNNEKKLNFIQVVSDYAIAKNTSNVISTKLNENSELVIGNSWRAPVYAKSPVIEKELKEMRLKKHGDDIMSLLRNIRNLKNHFDEKSTEFKNLMANGGSVNDMEFFFNMFPALISHVYEVMRSEEQKNPIFKNYFYASPDMNTIKEADGASISSSNISELKGTNSVTETDNAGISSSNISISENTNLIIKTRYKASLMSLARAKRSLSNIILCEGTNRKTRMRTKKRIVETDSASRLSSIMDMQQDIVEMEILMETWWRFIDSRAKNDAGQESFQIYGSVFTFEELSDQLTSTHDNLRASELQIQIAWEHFPYKGYLAFIYLVVLMLSSFLTLLYGVWWVGLVGLLSGPLLIISSQQVRPQI